MLRQSVTYYVVMFSRVMMIFLLNRYGHRSLRSIVLKFLFIVFRFLLFIFVISIVFFTMSLVAWIRLVDPTMLLFFPSVRVVGFSFSLSSYFESYPFLFSSVLICSLEMWSPFGV